MLATNYNVNLGPAAKVGLETHETIEVSNRQAEMMMNQVPEFLQPSSTID